MGEEGRSPTDLVRLRFDIMNTISEGRQAEEEDPFHL